LQAYFKSNPTIIIYVNYLPGVLSECAVDADELQIYVIDPVKEIEVCVGKTNLMLSLIEKWENENSWR